jgi:Methyltransferase domain
MRCKRQWPVTAAVDLDRRYLRYVRSGMSTVQGWFPRLAALEVVQLAQTQRAMSTVGPMCEIGVHHGRTLILLSLLSRSKEVTAGIDRYGLATAMGHSRYLHLESNFRAHGVDRNRVKILDADSRHLTTAKILELCEGAPRFFSLDGGRTAETTYHDIELACATLCDGGIAMIADYFQEAWPEVSEGVCRFMTQTPGLFPVAIGGNRLFLTKSRKCLRSYQEGLERAFAGQIKHSVMFGEPVLVIGRLTTRIRISQTKIWRAIRGTRVGGVLRSLGRPIK